RLASETPWLPDAPLPTVRTVAGGPRFGWGVTLGSAGTPRRVSGFRAAVASFAARGARRLSSSPACVASPCAREGRAARRRSRVAEESRSRARSPGAVPRTGAAPPARRDPRHGAGAWRRKPLMRNNTTPGSGDGRIDMGDPDIDILGDGKLSKASDPSAPLMVVFGGVDVSTIPSGQYMWNYMNTIKNRFHIFVAQSNEDVKPVLDRVHVVPHVLATRNRAHVDAAEHHHQRGARVGCFRKLPVAENVNVRITHVDPPVPTTWRRIVTHERLSPPCPRAVPWISTCRRSRARPRTRSRRTCSTSRLLRDSASSSRRSPFTSAWRGNASGRARKPSRATRGE